MRQIIKNAGGGAWQKLPPLGSRAYSVEWQTNVPVNEFGDCEPDRGDFNMKVIKTKGPAFAYAKRVLPEDYWGSVVITEVELTDPYGDELPWTYYWEYVGDPEYVTN
jgi:hypothetical protein